MNKSSDYSSDFRVSETYPERKVQSVPLAKLADAETIQTEPI